MVAWMANESQNIWLLLSLSSLVLSVWAWRRYTFEFVAEARQFAGETWTAFFYQMIRDVFLALSFIAARREKVPAGVWMHLVLVALCIFSTANLAKALAGSNG